MIIFQMKLWIVYLDVRPHGSLASTQLRYGPMLRLEETFAIQSNAEARHAYVRKWCSDMWRRPDETPFCFGNRTIDARLTDCCGLETMKWKLE